MTTTEMLKGEYLYIYYNIIITLIPTTPRSHILAKPSSTPDTNTKLHIQ